MFLYLSVYLPHSLFACSLTVFRSLRVSCLPFGLCVFPVQSVFRSLQVPWSVFLTVSASSLICPSLCLCQFPDLSVSLSPPVPWSVYLSVSASSLICPSLCLCQFPDLSVTLSLPVPWSESRSVSASSLICPSLGLCQFPGLCISRSLPVPWSVRLSVSASSLICLSVTASLYTYLILSVCVSIRIYRFPRQVSLLFKTRQQTESWNAQYVNAKPNSVCFIYMYSKLCMQPIEKLIMNFKRSS